ncbi:MULTISPECIES: DUF4835 family protein [Myroides]|uniref:DUF4835 family protein n=1 Tax=Myroides albus TaxID=2562892 RepID=A0A6I3LM47_9FLAO|nr:MULTISPECIES: DUF4835 family protein [Myroides]MTG98370.1 DUF4835 family protein [Myroides albus]MVX35721.1 DUF4835 family protein [Myroides sp. LoEW2-1]UVD80363.1 DUF4835 family protein [Myroides albus]
MNKLIWLISCFFLMINSYSQELHATVNINHSQVGNSNQAYFKNLEKSLQEFINNTSWGSKKYNAVEKVDCVFILTVTSYNNNLIGGSMQVQATRPIYNSSYSSPILNFNDKDISFSYIEFENLFYNPNSFDSNLTSLIAFYANMILGLDADSFQLEGGSEFYQNASSIVSIAQQSGAKGWKQGDGTNTRYYLVNDVIAGTGMPYRKALYNYHLKGLDVMSSNLENGRDGIFKSLQDLEVLHKNRPGSFLMRIFFDAKTEELSNIYSGVTDKNKKLVIELLNKLAPLNSAKWNNL